MNSWALSPRPGSGHKGSKSRPSSNASSDSRCSSRPVAKKGGYQGDADYRSRSKHRSGYGYRDDPRYDFEDYRASYGEATKNRYFRGDEWSDPRRDSRCEDRTYYWEDVNWGYQSRHPSSTVSACHAQFRDDYTATHWFPRKPDYRAEFQPDDYNAELEDAKCRFEWDENGDLHKGDERRLNEHLMGSRGRREATSDHFSERFWNPDDSRNASMGGVGYEGSKGGQSRKVVPKQKRKSYQAKYQEKQRGFKKVKSQRSNWSVGMDITTTPYSNPRICRPPQAHPLPSGPVSYRDVDFSSFDIPIPKEKQVSAISGRPGPTKYARGDKLQASGRMDIEDPVESHRLAERSQGTSCDLRECLEMKRQQACPSPKSIAGQSSLEQDSDVDLREKISARRLKTGRRGSKSPGNRLNVVSSAVMKCMKDYEAVLEHEEDAGDDPVAGCNLEPFDSSSDDLRTSILAKRNRDELNDLAATLEQQEAKRAKRSKNVTNIVVHLIRKEVQPLADGEPKSVQAPEEQKAETRKGESLDAERPRKGKSLDAETPRKEGSLDVETPRKEESLDVETPRKEESLDAGTPRKGESLDAGSPRKGESLDAGTPPKEESLDAGTPRKGEPLDMFAHDDPFPADFKTTPVKVPPFTARKMNFAFFPKRMRATDFWGPDFTSPVPEVENSHTEPLRAELAVSGGGDVNQIPNPLPNTEVEQTGVLVEVSVNAEDQSDRVEQGEVGVVEIKVPTEEKPKQKPKCLGVKRVTRSSSKSEDASAQSESSNAHVKDGTKKGDKPKKQKQGVTKKTGKQKSMKSVKVVQKKSGKKGKGAKQSRKRKAH